MKILIISVSRCGSTSLMNGIHQQGYDKLSEPYNPTRKDLMSYPLKFNNKRVCVKSLSTHLPPSFSHPIDFHVKFSKEFDRVIILDRLNFREHWISFCNLISKKDTNLRHTPWLLDDVTEEIEFGLIKDGWLDKFNDEKIFIQEISNKIEVPITYYENLYNEDREISYKTIKSLNLSIQTQTLQDYLDPSKKYGKSKKTLL